MIVLICIYIHIYVYLEFDKSHIKSVGNDQLIDGLEAICYKFG